MSDLDAQRDVLKSSLSLQNPSLLVGGMNIIGDSSTVENVKNSLLSQLSGKGYREEKGECVDFILSSIAYAAFPSIKTVKTRDGVEIQYTSHVKMIRCRGYGLYLSNLGKISTGSNVYLILDGHEYRASSQIVDDITRTTMEILKFVIRYHTDASTVNSYNPFGNQNLASSRSIREAFRIALYKTTTQAIAAMLDTGEKSIEKFIWTGALGSKEILDRPIQDILDVGLSLQKMTEKSNLAEDETLITLVKWMIDRVNIDQMLVIGKIESKPLGEYLN